MFSLALFLLGIAGYATISVFRHDHFASDAFDLGVYDQLIWGYSRFEILYNTVLMVPNLLGDHFHPILMLLAPIYWIWNDVRALLISQAILLSLAGVPIFWWAQRRLGLWPAVMVQGAYLVFWGILAGDVYDFHQLTVAVPAVSFAIYGALRRNDVILWTGAAVGLLSKEDISLTLLFLGIYLVLAQRRWPVGLLLSALSLGYFWVVVKLVIPAIRGGPYAHWTYTSLGSSPEAAVKNLLLKPWNGVLVAVQPFKKVQLMGALFLPWLLLPLFSPLLIVTIPLILERVWSVSPEFWSTHYQYSMVIAPVLAFATIDSLDRFRQHFPRQLTQARSTIATAAVLLAGLAVTFGAVRPLSEVGQYITTGQAAQVQSCLDTIPASASVAATDHLVPHLAHRDRIYLLPNAIGQAQYVAIGPRPGPHPRYLEQVSSAGYSVRCENSQVIVLSR